MPANTKLAWIFFWKLVHTGSLYHVLNIISSLSLLWLGLSKGIFLYLREAGWGLLSLMSSSSHCLPPTGQEVTDLSTWPGMLCLSLSWSPPHSAVVFLYTPPSVDTVHVPLLPQWALLWLEYGLVSELLQQFKPQSHSLKCKEGGSNLATVFRGGAFGLGVIKEEAPWLNPSGFIRRERKDVDNEDRGMCSLSFAMWCSVLPLCKNSVTRGGTSEVAWP